MHIYMYHEYTHMLYSWYTLNICIYNHNCMHNIAYTCIEHIYIIMIVYSYIVYTYVKYINIIVLIYLAYIVIIVCIY